MDSALHVVLVCGRFRKMHLCSKYEERTAAGTLVSAGVSVLLLLHMQPEDERHLSHRCGGELCTLMKALPWALPPQPGVHARKSSKGDLATGRQQQ